MYSWTERSLIAEELFMPLAFDEVFTLKRCVMSDEQEQDSSPIMPTEQQTIMFCQEPILLKGMGLRKGCRMATPD